MNNSIRNFLVIGKAEGYSYLVLLFIAMPLKYVMHQDIWVRIIGSLHGVLFIAFMYTILELMLRKHFNFKNAFAAFLLSLIPFGTFYLHRLLPSNARTK